ncbi:hypothetical protein ACFX2B_029093 [Malus domestica]
MSLLCKATDEERKVYIVYMGSLPDGDPAYSPLAHHLSILHSVVEDRYSPENLLVRSYKRSFNGFAANLTDMEKDKLANMKEVVSIFPSRTLQLQTTRSWDFMGLTEEISRNSSIVESDIIVGVFDTGIWPESDSFKDEGLGPPPKGWKGVCDGGKNFTCNNKLIGARHYGYESARDEIGHGTHTASTVAGNAVKDVNFYGLANGTARGGVPAAKIAAHQVCIPCCQDHTLLAAFDDAIADGVNIITISLGQLDPINLDEDAIAIGAFHAMKKGILTSQALGNLGLGIASVSSVAPWILTVAASNTDRYFVDKIVLASGTTLVGNSTNTFVLNGTSFPLIYGKDAGTKNCTAEDARNCEEGCLDSDLVKGKIVVCDEIQGDRAAYKSGALGSVTLNEVGYNVSLVPLLASTTLMKEEYNLVRSYMNSTRDPQANIFKSEVIKEPGAPTVAYFSSRGPHLILPDIIKPDITAPGVDILTAYPPELPITVPQDKRRANYNILYGTSMSCPHAAGASAYVKAFHPEWSPAAIKSSLLTTAWSKNHTNNNISTGAFAYGSGHINPVNAINPGLVYEASEEDYINLLCTIYDEGKVRQISGDKNSTCPIGSAKGSAKDHNYPSMRAKVEPTNPFSVNFHRRVKNVGLANSTYKAKIFLNSKVDIKVVPELLSFKSLNEEKDFDVTVVGSGLPDQSQVSGSLVWSDGVHSVRSPIVVYAYIQQKQQNMVS